MLGLDGTLRTRVSSETRLELITYRGDEQGDFRMAVKRPVTHETRSQSTSEPEEKRSGGDVLIVDNSDAEWKVRDYLREWTEIAHTFDIATGFFEIGALLMLDGQWQKLDKIRILMGDEVSKRTRKALVEGLLAKVKSKLDESIEHEKEANDFLIGVPAIAEALRKRQIECRVYTKDRFHAKAYITHAKLAVVGSAAGVFRVARC